MQIRPGRHRCCVSLIHAEGVLNIIAWTSQARRCVQDGNRSVDSLPREQRTNALVQGERVEPAFNGGRKSVRLQESPL